MSYFSKVNNILILLKVLVRVIGKPRDTRRWKGEKRWRPFPKLGTALNKEGKY